MDGYIKKSEAVDVIVKYPYDIAGKTATAIKMIEDLPSADVVLREELELSQHLLNGANESIEELGKWYKRLQHKYNLAVAEREANVKGFTEELSKAKTEVKRLQAEKDALIKNYAECMKDYAREIFAEIEENLNNLIRYYKEKREYVTEIEYSELEQRYCDIKIRTFEERLLKIAALIKKYTEGEDKPASEEKYFSPGDVAKMTHQEVREKYTAIRKSMKRW